MARYYNLVAGSSVPIMVEDVQQICDGQSIQLVVEDINNCANGTPQFVTYAAAPQHPEGLFHQSTILGNQLTGVPLDQRQNVYIIKTTNDLPVQQNALKADVIHTSLANDGLVNIVDERGNQYVIPGSKFLTNNIHELQQQQQQQQHQIQWVMPENNINYEASMKPATQTQKMTPTVKTPQQRTTQSLALQTPGQCMTPSASQEHGVPGPSDKKPVKYYKSKLRGGATGGGSGRTSLGPSGDAVLPAKKTPQPRQKITSKPQQQLQQLQTASTSPSSPVLERAATANSKLTNNSKTPNNGRKSFGVTYRAKNFGTTVSNATAQNPTAKQPQLTPAGTRPGVLKTPEASGQARNAAEVSQVMKSPLALHYPEMSALSERIKQDKMKKVLNISGAVPSRNTSVSSPVVATSRAPLHPALPKQQPLQIQRANQQTAVAQRTPLQIANNDKSTQRQQQLTPIQQRQQAQQMQTQQLTTPDPRQVIEIIKKPTSISCQPKYQRETSSTTASDNDERMEVDSGTSECGMDVADMNNVSQDGDERDNTSASVAYLQKTIENPQTTVVQEQITGNTVKMLVVLQHGEQRLITFDIPNEACTVLDLLEQANITFGEETSVSLVSDRTLGINYIVEGGSQMFNCQDVPEQLETYMIPENINTPPDSSSPNFGASDENSNSSVTQNEEPKYVEGKVAVCPNCGISSLDFNRCSRCKKKLPDNVKSMPTVPDSQAKETMMSIDSFYKKTNEQNSPPKVDATIGNKRVNKGGRRPAAKKRPVKEPECLIISSDEEEDGSGKRRKSDSTVTNASSMTGVLASVANDEADTIHEKEPVITNSSSSASTERTVESEDGGIKGGAIEDQNLGGGSVDKLQTSLQCRTVRIGSYKYVPREPIVVSQSGVRFAVPLLEDDTSFVNLEVKFKDIVRVLIHFGKMMPVLFFYTTTTTGAMIREVLGMQDSKGPYYDPAGKDHTHKRITLLPEKLSEDSKIILKNLFTPNEVLMELNPKEANDILVRASPKDHSQNTQSQGVATRRQGSTAAVNNNANGGEIQVMTVYPPPPAKGGIAINTEDYICLGVDQFLNDAIIDFYLRYLTLEVLSENDHNRTHVFSSYFYKRLTSPHAQAGELPATLTPAARRHARVQKWTKNVNIFEKDFIIIPINEHAHWFLAIICYPGLVGKVIVPPTPTRDSSIAKTVQKSKKMKEIKLQAVTIGSTTITPLATTITIDQLDEGSERDEAEGDDEEMEVDSDEDEEPEVPEEPSPSFSPLTPDMEERSMVKLPCILIFDSLAGASRSRVVATLRDYLSCEHLAKVGTEKTFSKDTIKGSSPKVPQQSNFTDCGLYLLQYVESFFKDPIRNYTFPMRTLKNWFEEIVVTRKREELAKLLVKLMHQTKGDKTIALPIVQFPTQAGKLRPKPEPPAEPKTPKIEPESKKKLIQQQTPNSVEDKTTLVAVRTSSVVTTAENSNEKEVATRTTYQIVLPPTITSPESNTSESIFDAKPRSSSGTLSYLRNKRIPRLMSREQETQEGQAAAAAAARKQKGDNDSVTKSFNNSSSSSSSSGSSVASLAKSVTVTNYDSCK